MSPISGRPGGIGENGDDIHVFDKRDHADSGCSEPERFSLLSDGTEKFYQGLHGELVLSTLQDKIRGHPQAKTTIFLSKNTFTNPAMSSSISPGRASNSVFRAVSLRV
jgi:hypothetical protein